MNKEAFLSRILNPNILSRAGQIAASDTAALKAFDKAMMSAARKGTVAPESKAMQAYAKYFMGPAHTAGKMAYGKKSTSRMDLLMAHDFLKGQTLQYLLILYNRIHQKYHLNS